VILIAAGLRTTGCAMHWTFTVRYSGNTVDSTWTIPLCRNGKSENWSRKISSGYKRLYSCHMTRLHLADLS